MINQNRLKDIFDYDKAAGLLVSKINRGRYKQGNLANVTNTRGYLQLKVDGKLYLSHRLIWMYVYGKFPGGHIDHINHIKTDNRILNLREVTAKENSKNLPKSSRNKTGVTGVSWYENLEKWRVRIEPRHLGYFQDKFEAICARKSAVIKYEYHENHGV